jgi:uncharacterized membrane protein HdeD (DUF308 family)
MLSEPLKKRIAGVLLMALGVGALSAPLTVGRWSLAALGIPLLVLSVAEAYAAFRSPQRDNIGAYLPSVLALLAGNLLILSSALVLSGLQGLPQRRRRAFPHPPRRRRRNWGFQLPRHR